MDSGALDHVQQFGVEIHFQYHSTSSWQQPISGSNLTYPITTRDMMKFIKDIQLKGNFRAISWEGNVCASKNEVYEIVFKKINSAFPCVL